MPSLHPPSASNDIPPPAPRLTRTVPAFGFVQDAQQDARRIWFLALAGALFAFLAANITALWPRWYSASLLSLAWQALKLVFIAAATGAAVVRFLWGVLRNPPAVGPTRIALNLSACWVFLPCMVLLYEAGSPWMLVLAAVSSSAMALGLRALLPAATDAARSEHRPVSALATLDGLPPADSPLLTAICVAILAHAALLLAAGGELVLAASCLCIGVFLLVWRWSAAAPGSAQRWLGTNPPLRQAVAALVLTALCIIPFSVGHGGFGPRHAASSNGYRAMQRHESTGAGYAGIILYPPPVKKQIVAPAPQDATFRAGVLSKPMLIRFDGPYWYFKAPSTRPGPRAHIAHAKPTDVNVRSTDLDPLIMEAHQTLATPIDLAHCGEIDLAITNADIHPGEIDLAILLTDSATVSAPEQLIGRQPIVSSQFVQIPLNRAPVHETLHFPIPPTRTIHRFNQITVLFLPSRMHARAGSKVSVDSFELLPRP